MNRHTAHALSTIFYRIDFKNFIYILILIVLLAADMSLIVIDWLKSDSKRIN